MPKPAIIIAGVVGVAVVIGGGVLLTNNSDSPSTSKDAGTSSQNQSAKTVVNDPDGIYDFFSDQSVTKYPENGFEFGNGQTFAVEYDGSKTGNDEYATLTYQLFYIQDNGGVIPMGGGNFGGKGKGTFSTTASVFNSSAKDRKGFLEVTATYDAKLNDSNEIKATNVQLGMYPISFDVAE